MIRQKKKLFKKHINLCFFAGAADIKGFMSWCSHLMLVHEKLKMYNLNRLIVFSIFKSYG